LEEQRAIRAKRREEGGDDEEDDDDDEEEENPDSVFSFDRSKEKKVTIADNNDDEEDKPKGLLAGLQKANNPNLVKKTEKMIKAKDLATMDGPVDEFAGMNRKEREALEAQRKHEEYMRRTAAGETEQGRKDLERLAAIRKKREEDKLKREAEGRAPGWTPNGVESSSDSDDSDSDDDKPKVAKAPAGKAEPAKLSDVAAKKKAAAAEVVSDSSSSGGGLEILKSIDIKKMNGDALKDALKARGLPYDGQKKDLMKRLTDHEAQRSK
jgi:hypothetical protein